MKIGVFSDTHDNLPKIDKAVRFFNKNKVGFVLHAGDFIAPFVVARLKHLNSDWCGIFGNNDGERIGLTDISEGKIKVGPLRLKLDNKNITLVHDINQIDAKREPADVIIFGHTHKAQITKQDNKLLINPGECAGWLTNKSTIALIDLTSLSVKIVTI
jgi:putative phosphoesterase